MAAGGADHGCNDHQRAAVAVLFEWHQPAAHHFRFYGDRDHDVADGVYYHHREYRSLDRLDAGAGGIADGLAVHRRLEHLGGCRRGVGCERAGRAAEWLPDRAAEAARAGGDDWHAVVLPWAGICAAGRSGCARLPTIVRLPW